MSKPEISVIIPVLNMADRIEKCLEAVISQSFTPCEVIVVDGYSNDGTVEKAQRFPVRILYDGNGTRGSACQVGIERAEGEYIAFTDADCIPDKDWLAGLVNEFKDGVVGVGGRIVNVERSFWEKSISLAMNTFFGGANTIQARLFKTKRFVKSLSGCNSMYRRQDLLSVGFKTSLPGAEDAVLNWQLRKKGKLVYLPQSVILHDHRRGLKQFARKMYRYGADRGVARLFGLQVIPALVAPLLLLSLLLTRWVVVGLLVLYVLIAVLLAMNIAIREKNIRYVVAIPCIYVIEHILYILGFWKGLITRKI